MFDLNDFTKSLVKQFSAKEPYDPLAFDSLDQDLLKLDINSRKQIRQFVEQFHSASCDILFREDLNAVAIRALTYYEMCGKLPTALVC